MPQGKSKLSPAIYPPSSHWFSIYFFRQKQNHIFGDLQCFNSDPSKGQANLQLAIWNKQAESTSSEGLYIRIQELGLPARGYFDAT